MLRKLQAAGIPDEPLRLFAARAVASYCNEQTEAEFLAEENPPAEDIQRLKDLRAWPWKPTAIH